MGRRRLLCASTAALLIVGAPAHARVFRAEPCQSAYGAYMLAPNSAAIIRIDRPIGADPLRVAQSSVIVYRPTPGRGWASRRLLSRFDVRIEGLSGRVRNLGAICAAAP